jgi:polyketide synthase PksN
MDKIYKYIIENNINGKIPKEIAVDMISLLKEKGEETMDIAITGIALRTSLANNVNDFWYNLKGAKDCIRKIPRNRQKDLDKFNYYYQLKNAKDVKTIAYKDLAYLDEIDKFDYRYFGFSPKEAQLMNPSQRIFLEVAYNAIEDAGLARTIKNSNTGVYVGATSRTVYKDMVSEIKSSPLKNYLPDSVTPSRLSYYLNLTGPSMLVNTSCSSSLVAIHLGCKAIQNKDCSQVIIGGVSVEVKPPQIDRIYEGLESFKNTTCSFDNNAEGTNFSEGVAVLVLKPLNKAIEDHDQIYAVIKGSAINQDGKSPGIAAPNAKAQKKLILSAWQDAGIDPETISYIEAHGTGTKLGDPIEVEAITQAFKEYTSRKQFCAIGSVKSNIGHTVEASGIFGLIKAALALRYKQIPPSIHFKEPNQKINWENSPVYVNTKLSKWKKLNKEEFLRCGVNSFGITGTNCHIVVEEAPSIENISSSGEYEKYQIFTISAKDKEVLKQLAKDQLEYIKKNNSLKLKDICYTLNIGREHHRYRIAIIVASKEDLLRDLSQLVNQSLNNFKEEIKQNDSDMFTIKVNIEIEKYKKKKLKKFLISIAKLYKKGANPNWEKLYHKSNVKKVSLPTYPFKKTRCWTDVPKIDKRSRQQENKDFIHPLLDQCLSESFNQDVYSTMFSSNKHFLLSDHVINDRATLPGATYIEIAYQLGKRYFSDSKIVLKDILFHLPLILGKDEEREVQTIVKKENYFLNFSVMSKIYDGKWLKHASGKIYKADKENNKIYVIENLKKKCNKEKITIDFKNKNYKNSLFKFGPRWDNSCQVMLGGDTALVKIKLNYEFESDLKKYYFHPALLDIATSAMIFATPKKNKENMKDVLPFSYKSIKILGPTPAEFYSYFKRIDEEMGEIKSYDISLINKEGVVFTEIKEVVFKSFDDFSKLILDNRLIENNYYHQIVWQKKDLLAENREILDSSENGAILLFKNDSKRILELEKNLIKKDDEKLITVTIGSKFKKLNDRYVITNNQRDYNILIKDLIDKNITKIIHGLTVSKDSKGVGSIKELNISQEKGAISLFYLTKALQENRYVYNMDIILLSSYVNKVNNYDKLLRPENATLFGVGKTLSLENPHLRCRAIDIDDKTKTSEVLKEINAVYTSYNVAYRNNTRYQEFFYVLDLDKTKKNNIKIKAKGIYVITGGGGGIGLEMAKNLVEINNRVKIALIGRSDLTEEKKIVIREMDGLGAEVKYYKGDVSKYEQIKKIIGALKKKYKKINGVIHTAGIAGDGFMIRKDIKTFKSVLAPKVLGVWILYDLVKNMEPDFFVMFSSVTSIFSAAGQSDYTAANSYLDAFSKIDFSNKTKNLSINWCAWREVGMAVDYEVNTDGIFKAISNKKAKECFNDILESDITNKNVIVGKLNYDFLHDYNDKSKYIYLSSDVRNIIKKVRTNKIEKNKKNEKVKEAKIKGKKAGIKYTDVEYGLAQIWFEVLGYIEININDNFFELGGDSLLVMQIVNKIKTNFNMDLSLKDVFRYPIFSDLVAKIEKELIEKNI